MSHVHVAGRNAGKVLLYALSTCPWCRKTKDLLNSLGVEYSYIDVDLAVGDEREQAVAGARRWNPSMSFPVIVINDQRAILGFSETQIREALRG